MTLIIQVFTECRLDFQHPDYCSLYFERYLAKQEIFGDVRGPERQREIAYELSMCEILKWSLSIY